MISSPDKNLETYCAVLDKGTDEILVEDNKYLIITKTFKTAEAEYGDVSVVPCHIKISPTGKYFAHVFDNKHIAKNNAGYMLVFKTKARAIQELDYHSAPHIRHRTTVEQVDVLMHLKYKI